MKRKFLTLFIYVVLAFALTVFANASENIVKVGLYYNGSALESANLENKVGSGYLMGWFDEATRDFVSIGRLDDTAITVMVKCGYHVQIEDEFASFKEAKYVADQFRTGFVCYINNTYRVRVNTFSSKADAEVAAVTYTTYEWYDINGGVHPFVGFAASPSATEVTVINTNSKKLLFEFDCSGAKSLGILPNEGQEGTLTWFKGYMRRGGFEYRRSTGGNINVINVLRLEDYVKGVVPYEAFPSWPLETLKAQAVCARTYVLTQTKHKSHKFDVCDNTHCQRYCGTNEATATTDQAVDETRGIVMTYDGKLATPYYYSSNGGASESAENVWKEPLPYIVGKEDPYEETISIPGYTYSEVYTFEQLTQLLRNKGYDIGEVCVVYVSKTTPTGNVAEVTFADTTGKTVQIQGYSCSQLLSTSMFGQKKSIRSIRYVITGGETANNYYVNDASTGVNTVSGLYTISGNGTVESYTGGETYVITSSGTSLMEDKTQLEEGAGVTVTGKGSGHNIGMSQYGAKAMALLGYTYEDILNFYFTNISLERIGIEIENP